MRGIVRPFVLALALIITTPLAGVGISDAQAKVCYGKNVRVGGHLMKPGCYKSMHIERTTKRPPWYGCRIFKRGSVYQGKRIRERTEICNLKTIPYNKRKK